MIFIRHFLLKRFFTLTNATNLEECRKNFFNGGDKGLDNLISLCETVSKVHGCQKACEDRVDDVFGKNDMFDLFFFQINKPKCNRLCNDSVHSKFSDLITTDYKKF